MTDDIHYISICFIGRDRVITDIGEKSPLKIGFVGSVGLQVHGKFFVVRGGKGICCIVNQLAHGIVIQNFEFILLLEAFRNSLHIVLAGHPVMTP